MFLHKWTNVLSPERLKELQDKLIGHPGLNAGHESSRYVRWCIEGNPPEADEFLPDIEPLVKEVYTKPLKYANSCVRTYMKDGWMGVHTDRKGLDITVSFCLKKETKGDWPLNVSKIEYGAFERWNNNADMSEFKKDFEAVNLETNDMCCILGTQNAHWRDKLVCEEDETNTYIFYHWSFDDALVSE